MAFSHFMSSLLSPSMMLALVATIGYFVGRRRLRLASNDRANSRQEVLRALAVAQELESITHRLRKSLSSHVPAVVKFNSRLTRLEQSDDFGWNELCDRANELLKPALRLSAEISNAHASILQQMTQLSLFAELRTDPLTGAANRRAFDDSLEAMVKQFARYKVPVSVVMLDIDYFKRVNDQYGHMQGDIVLRELAELLRASLRECDLVARYGGEEFAIVMPHTQLRAATHLGERLRASIEDKMTVTASLGIAELGAGDTPATFVQHADVALYQAKVNGRNRIFVHDQATGRSVDAPSFCQRGGASVNETSQLAPSESATEAVETDLAGCHLQAE